MTKIRTANEIILSMIDYIRNAQPNLTTSPGSVSRDLMDGFSVQTAMVYDELARISTMQSLRLALGSDLDKLASNFGAVRRQGSKASGVALLTFTDIPSDINIDRGSILNAKNGATFVILNGMVVSAVFSNTYRAIATQYRAELDLLGITDQYAAEVTVEAAAPGIQGNISKYTLNTSSIDDVANVTNVVAFGGGAAAEDDATFRNRVLAIFSGANTGTALGYRNAVLTDPAALDAIVIQPGDPLMTRDGTQVIILENGTKKIISEGTGGKVDIYAYGLRLQEVIDSYIYRNKSNTTDPSNPKNDYVLGQISADEGKTVTRKRLDDIQNGVLPSQPVNNLLSVSGSLSGANFVEKSVDGYGRITGNYELIRDTGAYAGSPWGFDRLHWISDHISNLLEDKSKISFNGQDPLNFTDVTSINVATQNINITNENSKIYNNDRTIIQLAHYPATNVTRVFNLTNGERYTVVSQNIDGTGNFNTTGRIRISGRTLPATSDILQVDYTWVMSYDRYFDYDNRETSQNPRIVNDSIDWGYSNIVRREEVTLTNNGDYWEAQVTHPVSSVISVNTFENESPLIVGELNGRLKVDVSSIVNNVVSIVNNSNGAELYATNSHDGTFNGSTIFLPTDTTANFGDIVSVTYNAVDIYNGATQGSFTDNIISVPLIAVPMAVQVECNYLADVKTILPSTTLNLLPAFRNSSSVAIGPNIRYNRFDTTGTQDIGNQPCSNIFSAGTIIKNLRSAPSRLALTVNGSITPGTFTINGTSITGAFDIVYAVGTSGLTQDLSSALRRALGLKSNESVNPSIKIARLDKMERVTATNSFEVLDVLDSYDIQGYTIKDNSFVKFEALSNPALGDKVIVLPSTTNNISNAPQVGDRIRVSFHYMIENDSENIFFSRSGTMYGAKTFGIVESINISSGFTSVASLSATLSVNNMNQPINSSRYGTRYDYLAPKTNERISIRYNYNRMIGDTTFAVENTRPITADVLVKAAVPIMVNVTMNIVPTPEFVTKTSLLLQNVQDIITSTLNANALGTTIDSSDLINAAYSASGVDRARIIFFNKSNEPGSVLSITAQKNEYIIANEVIINLETR